MIRRPPRSTHCISSAASDVYKRQPLYLLLFLCIHPLILILNSVRSSSFFLQYNFRSLTTKQSFNLTLFFCLSCFLYMVVYLFFYFPMIFSVFFRTKLVAFSFRFKFFLLSLLLLRLVYANSLFSLSFLSPFTFFYSYAFTLQFLFSIPSDLLLSSSNTTSVP
eukprot:TRINITY_DN3921_c0_g1_i2.p2 TRINITY_DN3921_c0_g1~~TRINITY_DN3921_c0_g1_i2.p2  ORF type:complete len:163 (+),score=12.85 TRINITY_DN3921_c0_g1_i2:124-612(+)